MSIDINKDNSISISGFDKGIGQSILSDFSDMLGVNTDIPSVLSAGYKFNRLTEETTTNFVIATAGDDYFTLATPNHRLNKRAVKLSTTGTLPTGLNTSNYYYLWDINNDGLTFRFCNNIYDVGTSYINLSDTGTGTHSFTLSSPRMVRDYTFDSHLNLYCLDNNQKVWFSQQSDNYQSFYLLGGNTSSGSGNGIIYYCGYILVWGNSKIDAMAEINDPATTPVWNNDFASAYSISNTATYPSNGARPFYSQYDNAIYFNNGIAVTGNVYRVGLLEQNVGERFNPTNTATWSLVIDAIELPYDNGTGYTQTINEIGEYILIGTFSNTIYYWDRKSILPIYAVNMPENNTTSIVVKGSIVYAFNGYNGKFYQITTNSYGKVFEIPRHLFGIDYTADVSLSGDRANIEYTDAKLFGDEILFTIEVNGKSYVMSYNLIKKTIEKKGISSWGELLTDNLASGVVGKIYKIITLNKTTTNKNDILISTTRRISGAYQYTIEGWQYSGSLTSTMPGSSYHYVHDDDNAYVSTGLINYGDEYNKKTIRETGFYLSRPLTTGQGIKVYYRYDDNSTWTPLSSISYSSDGGIKTIKKNSPITNIIDLQIKIVINGYNSGDTTGTSPYLKYIRLIP